MDSDSIQLGRAGMFFIGGALGTAVATVIGFMTMMTLDESVAQATPSTVTTLSTQETTATTVDTTQGTGVTLVDAVETTLTLVGTEFAYSPVDATVTGPFELVFENAGRVIHNVEIEGVSGLVLEADPGNSDAAKIQLEPGTYVIFCSIAGHREAGMEGTLTVEG